MTAPEAPPVVIEVRLDATPEKVFAHFTDPHLLGCWLVGHAEADARPGGTFRVFLDSGPVVAGKYVELRPPHRLVLTWGAEGHEAVPPGSTIVEIDLMRDAEATMLRLVHRGLPDDERVDHVEGWRSYCEQLGRAVRENEPGL